MRENDVRVPLLLQKYVYCLSVVLDVYFRNMQLFEYCKGDLSESHRRFSYFIWLSLSVRFYKGVFLQNNLSQLTSVKAVESFTRSIFVIPSAPYVSVVMVTHCRVTISLKRGTGRGVIIPKSKELSLNTRHKMEILPVLFNFMIFLLQITNPK